MSNFQRNAKQERTKRILDLQRSDDDLAILEAGKEIEQALLDLKEPIENRVAVILKNMDTYFLHAEDKKTNEIDEKEFLEYIGKWI